MDEMQFLEFVSKIGVMKPAVVKDDNLNQMKKMLSIMIDKDYMAEEKIDGCHYLCIGCRFFSTEGVEKTDNYPHLRDFFISLGMPNLILDGEINYPGKTSQFCTRVTGSAPDVAIANQNTYGPIHYTFWDMLRTPKGTWLINQPLHKRRKLLEEFYARFIEGTSMEKYVHLSNVCPPNSSGKQFYEEIIAAGREGAVFKRLDSLYIMGKKPMWQWMKMKQKDEADFFISGYEAPTKKYTGKNLEDWPYWADENGVLIPVTKNYSMNWIGALELSAYVDGKPTVICTCAGLSEDWRRAFSEAPATYINKVVKTEYMETTEANIPRHPRFKCLHESKTAKECTWTLNK